jgi:hypothetical protein
MIHLSLHRALIRSPDHKHTIMTPRLPPELIREISFNYSKSRDAKSLSSAALVSSSFRDAFQKVIFSRINIRKQHLDEDDSPHHLAGLDIFRQNETLISFVREVSIRNTAAAPFFPFSIVNEEPMATCTVELIQLLATSAITSFIYIGWYGPIGDGFEDAIIKFLGSPCLRSLTLSMVPLELLRFVSSPCLNKLVYSRGLEDFHPPLTVAERLAQLPSAVRNHSITPTHLELNVGAPVIDLLAGNSSVIDLRIVKSLRLAPDNARGGNFWPIVMRCAPTLHTLNIATNGRS